MALTYPLALLLLAALPVAWWLYQRNAARAVAPHPLWFLVAGEQRPRPQRARRPSLRIVLLLALVAVLAVAAAGPVVRPSAGRTGVVVELSLATDRERVRKRLAQTDDDALVVVASPETVRTLSRADALARAGRADFVAAGTVSSAQMRAGIALARRAGATRVELVTAPPVTADIGIARARFVPARLQPERGVLVVELSRRGTHPMRVQLSARGRQPLWTRSVDMSGDHQVVEVPYRGRGGDLVELELRAPPGDQLAANNRAIVEIPILAPTPVYIERDLARTPAARAVAVLPTAQVVATPSDRAVVLSRRADTTTPGRAVVVIESPTASRSAPLLAVPDSPLAGLTPRLLDEHPFVPVRPAVVPPEHVWLRAGAQPAIYTTSQSGRDEVVIAAPLSGPVLAVAVADIFAAEPARHGPTCATQQGGDRSPGHHETDAGCLLVQAGPLPHAARAAPSPGSERLGAQRGATAPGFALITILLVAAGVLLVAETVVARPGAAGLASRAGIALLILAAAGGARTPAHRRVVFVVDVSASMGDLAPAMAELRSQLAELSKHDQAAAVIVAGGAEIVAPLGSVDAVAAWARHPAIEPSIGPSIDRRTTDLTAGFALAAQLLGDAPGDVVVISDGHDTRRGPRAFDAPALAGYSVRFVAMDRGDIARIAAIPVGLRGRAGAALAIPVNVEATRNVRGQLAIYLGTTKLASRDVELARGATSVTLAVTITAPGEHKLHAVLSVAGDAAPQNNQRDAYVRISGQPQVLDLRAASAGAADDPRELARYDLIVADDVPYDALGDRRAAHLAAFVRAGGTLLLSGRRSAFGPGGYANTVLDRISPLRSDPRAGEHGAAVVLLLDRSGSVSQVTGAPNLPGSGQLAALASRLSGRDLFGVIAFDVAAYPVRPLRPVGDRTRPSRLPLAHGGTNPVAALRMARRWLLASGERRRVVMLVSDGGFPTYYAAARRAAAALAAIDARLVVLAIGRVTPERATALRRLAAAGNGVVITGRDLNAAAVALQVRPLLAAAAEVRSRPRPVLATLLGKDAARAVRSVQQYVPTGLSTDATTLADIGDKPLLAVRSAGGGHVFALATKLHPALVPLRNEIAAFSVRARQRPAHLRLTPTQTPHVFRVTVNRSPSFGSVLLITNDHKRQPLALTYRGANTYERTLHLDRDTTLSVPGAGTIHVAIADPEHASLANLRQMRPSSSLPPVVVAARVSQRPLVIIAVAIGLILVLIAGGRSSEKTRARVAT